MVSMRRLQEIHLKTEAGFFDEFRMLAIRPFAAVAAIATLCFPGVVCAQFTDPRTYTPGSVGANDLEFDYTYARANASIDTSLVVGSGTLELNKGDVSYTHNFGLLGHFAWVNATVPYASLRGSAAESNISGSSTGPGDSSLEIAGLLKGGEALSAAELAMRERTTSVGVSLTVTVPTVSTTLTRCSILARTAGRLSQRLVSRIPSDPARSGRSTDTSTRISSLTTLHIGGLKSSARSRNRALRGTSVIPLRPAFGRPWIPAMGSAVKRSSTG